MKFSIAFLIFSIFLTPMIHCLGIRSSTSDMGVFGEYNYLKLINSLGTNYYTNKSIENGNIIMLSFGDNSLYVSRYDSPNLNEFDLKYNQTFLIKKFSSSNTSLYLNDYSHLLIHHVYLDLGMVFDPYYYIQYYAVDVEFGLRFAITPWSKLKIGINAFLYEPYYHFGCLIDPGAMYCYHLTSYSSRLILGVEGSLSKIKNSIDYMYSWFADLVFDLQSMGKFHLGLKAGLNFRFHPLLSFSVGVGIHALDLIQPYVSHAEFTLFLKYNLYICIPQKMDKCVLHY
jgi:hypothetical protein